MWGRQRKKEQTKKKKDTPKTKKQNNESNKDLKSPKTQRPPTANSTQPQFKQIQTPSAVQKKKKKRKFNYTNV